MMNQSQFGIGYAANEYATEPASDPISEYHFLTFFQAMLDRKDLITTKHSYRPVCLNR
jgi:hypothetical protein